MNSAAGGGGVGVGVQDVYGSLDDAFPLRVEGRHKHTRS